MLELCVTVLLALHLLCVNVATAGPLVCMWFETRERKDPLVRRTGQFLANASVVLLVVGIVIGFWVGWLSWSPTYREALSFLSRRIVTGLAEIAFSLILMAIYAWWFVAVREPSRWHRVGRATLPLLASTNLMYHFPLLFVILTNTIGQSNLPGEPLGSAEFLRMISQSDVLARIVHFWMASLAVTGVLLMVYAVMRVPDPSDAGRVAVWGGRIAVVPTFLQLPIGMWILFSMTDRVQQRLMGGNFMATTLLAISILIALWLMHQLSSIAMGNVTRRGVVLSASAMLLAIILMTGTSRQAKSPKRSVDASFAVNAPSVWLSCGFADWKHAGQTDPLCIRHSGFRQAKPKLLSRDRATVGERADSWPMQCPFAHRTSIPECTSIARRGRVASDSRAAWLPASTVGGLRSSGRGKAALRPRPDEACAPITGRVALQPRNTCDIESDRTRRQPSVRVLE